MVTPLRPASFSKQTLFMSILKALAPWRLMWEVRVNFPDSVVFYGSALKRPSMSSVGRGIKLGIQDTTLSPPPIKTYMFSPMNPQTMELAGNTLRNCGIGCA